MVVAIVWSVSCTAYGQEVPKAASPNAAQARTSVPTQSNSVQASQASGRASDSLYIALLEKVNSQLSLATNPWSLMVSGLGLLFTIGAIIAGWLLYRQGKDFREQRATTLNDAAQVVTGAVSEMRAAVESLMGDVRSQTDQLHADLTKRIEDATTRSDKATGDAKAAIDKERKGLQELKAAVETRQKALAHPPTPATIVSSGVLTGIDWPGYMTVASSMFQKKQTCVSCRKEFNHPDSLSAFTVSNLFGSIECPYCHTVQQKTSY